jgi:hypothetical protein
MSRSFHRVAVASALTLASGLFPAARPALAQAGAGRSSGQGSPNTQGRLFELPQSQPGPGVPSRPAVRPAPAQSRAAITRVPAPAPAPRPRNSYAPRPRYSYSYAPWPRYSIAPPPRYYYYPYLPPVPGTLAPIQNQLGRPTDVNASPLSVEPLPRGTPTAIPAPGTGPAAEEASFPPGPTPPP